MYITMIVIRTNLFIFILDDPVTGLASSSSTFSSTSSLPVLNTLGVRTLMSLVARPLRPPPASTAPTCWRGTCTPGTWWGPWGWCGSRWRHSRAGSSYTDCSTGLTRAPGVEGSECVASILISVCRRTTSISPTWLGWYNSLHLCSTVYSTVKDDPGGFDNILLSDWEAWSFTAKDRTSDYNYWFTYIL